jgi:hypothetical protein
VDVLPLFAFGLAGCFEWCSRSRRRHVVATVVTTAAVALSVVQMLQYWNGVLPISDTTWEQYRGIFLRLQ